MDRAFQRPRHETSFFDGIDVSLGGIATLAQGDTEFLKDGLAEIARHRGGCDEAVFSWIGPPRLRPLLAAG